MGYYDNGYDSGFRRSSYSYDDFGGRRRSNHYGHGGRRDYTDLDVNFDPEYGISGQMYTTKPENALLFAFTSALFQGLRSHRRNYYEPPYRQDYPTNYNNNGNGQGNGGSSNVDTINLGGSSGNSTSTNYSVQTALDAEKFMDEHHINYDKTESITKLVQDAIANKFVPTENSGTASGGSTGSESTGGGHAGGEHTGRATGGGHAAGEKPVKVKNYKEGEYFVREFKNEQNEVIKQYYDKNGKFLKQDKIDPAKADKGQAGEANGSGQAAGSGQSAPAPNTASTVDRNGNDLFVIEDKGPDGKPIKMLMSISDYEQYTKLKTQQDFWQNKHTALDFNGTNDYQVENANRRIKLMTDTGTILYRGLKGADKYPKLSSKTIVDGTDKEFSLSDFTDYIKDQEMERMEGSGGSRDYNEPQNEGNNSWAPLIWWRETFGHNPHTAPQEEILNRARTNARLRQLNANK